MTRWNSCGHLWCGLYLLRGGGGRKGNKHSRKIPLHIHFNHLCRWDWWYFHIYHLRLQPFRIPKFVRVYLLLWISYKVTFFCSAWQKPVWTANWIVTHATIRTVINKYYSANVDNHFLVHNCEMEYFILTCRSAYNFCWCINSRPLAVVLLKRHPSEHG